MDSDNPPPQLRNNKIRGDELSFHVLLPQEIIEEILAKLPVKSLLRFKCVSKSWRSLIESERFIKIHMQSSRDDKTYAHWRVIFNCLEASGVFCLKQCSRRSLEDETPIDLSPIEDPTNNNQPISGNIVDCCNGMLCIIKKRRFFMLFNPATRIFHSLPVIDTAGIHIHGFGWDETSNAYKVFASMLDKDNHTIGRVYSTKTDSWKTIEHEVPHSRVYENGKFACGKTHWLVKSGHGTQIEYFNLKSEAFGLIELPFKPEVNSWLVETNGCLGVSRYNDETRLYDVWVMKEYGVKESWVKESWLVTRTKITRFHGWHSYYETLVSPIVALTGPEIKC